MRRFSNIGTGEVRTLTVGFKRLLGSGVVLVDGNITVTVDFYEFSDIKTGTPSEMLNGDPQVNDAVETIEGVATPIGQAALQSIDGSEGVPGADYVATFSAVVAGEIQETITEQVLFSIAEYVPSC